MGQGLASFVPIFLLAVFLSFGGMSHAAPADALPEESIGEESSTASPSQGAPSVFLEETEYDFGETTERGNVSHDFRIVNTGSAELKITQVIEG